MNLDSTAIATRLVALREALEAKVWPTAVDATIHGNHDRIRDLVKLKVDIEAITFALEHRPVDPAEGAP